MLPDQETNDQVIIQGLINDVRDLKSKCDRLEMLVETLQSRCNMHERYLEEYQQEIVRIKH